VPEEIERKFLVEDETWRVQARSSVRIRQGYIIGSAKASVRVRVSGNRAWLTIKSATEGVSRAEFDYEIPHSDAELLMDTLCARPLIEKTRHFVDHCGRCWEIDVFEGDNLGLVVAEVELASEDERFELPPWVGKEVSDDPRYYNASLVSLPYSRWKGS
jgi:adenylate cyclase